MLKAQEEHFQTVEGFQQRKARITSVHAKEVDIRADEQVNDREIT